MNQLPLARTKNIVIQESGQEVLIYDLKTHKAYCLNDTSSIIWHLCDGNNSVSDISQQLSRRLKSTVSEDFVWLALNELKKNDLLANSQAVPDKFGGLSRREVVRRVGVASMIALPVISSLVAPTAAQAQSVCIADGQACIDDGSFAQGACCTGSRCYNDSQCHECRTSGQQYTSCPDPGCCSLDITRSGCCDTVSAPTQTPDGFGTFSCFCP